MTSQFYVGSSNVLELGVLMEVLFKDEFCGLSGYLSKNRCNVSQFTIFFMLLSKSFVVLESALFPNGSYILNICLNGEKYFDVYFISFSIYNIKLYPCSLENITFSSFIILSSSSSCFIIQTGLLHSNQKAFGGVKLFLSERCTLFSFSLYHYFIL